MAQGPLKDPLKTVLIATGMLLCAGGLIPASAQDTKKAPPASAPPFARAAGETLVIVADGEPNAQAVDVEGKIRLGVTYLLRGMGKLGLNENFPADRVHAETLEPNEFDILARFISEGVMSREQPKENGNIQLSATVPWMWTWEAPTV